MAIDTENDKTPYTDITYGMRGWFAVLMCWYPEDNTWDVLNSGIGSYKTQDGARQEAKDWARAEEVRYNG